jgi:hypothetical protein
MRAYFYEKGKIFPSWPLVHKSPYVGLYHYYRGGLSPTFQVTSLFFGASRFLRTSTPWASSAMASLPLPMPGRRPFRGNALVAPIMGDSPPVRFDQIHPGWGDLPNFHQGDLRGLSRPQHGATAMASTAVHTWKTPVPGQRACAAVEVMVKVVVAARRQW